MTPVTGIRAGGAEEWGGTGKGGGEGGRGRGAGRGMWLLRLLRLGVASL